jgi:hypothetical protein
MNITNIRNLFWSVLLLSTLQSAKAYTSIYNGITYSSPQPYNLNVYYFKAADVPLDATHHRRVSEMMNWLQHYYAQQMQANGYGYKPFGLLKNTNNTDSIRLVLINGALNLDAYRNSGNDLLINEVRNFENNHPELIASNHSVILVAAPNFNSMNGLPYYGLGKMCFATDYPQLDMQYMGQTGLWADRFVTYFGGLAHELGHGLNLPHSHQTRSEKQNLLQGTNLMADGNYTLTRSPTFINRAGCAILNNCQVFATDESIDYYNGNSSGLLSLKTVVSPLGNKLTLSGKFVSNRTVKDINFYQDPFASPSQGYTRVAFSVPPINGDSFYVEMPVIEVLQGASTWPTSGPYNLEIELVLHNGETASSGYLYSYQNSVPQVNFSFNDINCTAPPPDWTLEDIGSPFFQGTACFNLQNNAITMRNWGKGYEDAFSDDITYLYKTIGTQDTIQCRVRSITTIWNDLIGIMIRSGTEPDAAFASVSALDYRGVFWQWRTNSGGQSAYNIVSQQNLPLWLRLIRNGNQIRAFYSQNGVQWTLYQTRNITLPSTALAGVVVAKNGARGVIDNLKLGNSVVTSNRTMESELPAIVKFKNPFGDQIKLFNPPHSGIARLVLYNNMGIKIFTKELGPKEEGDIIQLAASALPGGNYTIILYNKNGELLQTERLVKF